MNPRPAWSPWLRSLPLGCCLPLVLLGAPLKWSSHPDHRTAPVRPSAGSGAGFTLIAPADSGLTFSNRLRDATVAQNRLLELGSGVALGDVDGDGQVDVYLCGLEGDNVLYRNRGDWTFEDITAVAGVGCPRQFSTGCVLVDLDGDRDLDLLVNSLGGGTRAFLNDGWARFTEAAQPGLSRTGGATSMALADVEGDGDLDLYVAHYRTDTFQDPPRGIRMETRRLPDGSTEIEPRERFIGLPTYSGGTEVIERGEADLFYVSRGGTNFVAAPWNVGVFLNERGEALTHPPSDWGLAVMFRDVNGDRLPDLYVCNDFVYWTDRLWLNQAGRRFQEAPRMALRSISLSSMSMDVADINRDGHDDFFVAEMLSPRRGDRARQRPDTLENAIRWPVENPGFRPELTRNTLQLSRGDGTWAEIAQLAGVAATDWTWSSAFLDVDLDGWEDLLVTTGNNHDVQDADVQSEIIRSGGWKSPERRLQSLAQLPRRETPSMAFRNRRDLTFEETSKPWGFDQRGIAHGLALGDLDNDGDLDAVVNTLNAPARLLRNNTPAPRLAVRLRGSRANTAGINARITVRGGPVTQSQEMIAGGRYLSGDDSMRVFAAGEASELEVEVVWRSGRRSVVGGLKPDQIIEITEDGAGPPSAAAEPQPAPLFALIPVEEFPATPEALPAGSNGPLLQPRQTAFEGPGVAWSDLDHDGDEDLVVSAAPGGAAHLFWNRGTNRLEASQLPSAGSHPTQQQSAVLVEADAPPGRGLFFGLTASESAAPDTPAFETFPPFSASPDAHPGPLPSAGSSTGPLAMADVDRDGDLDLLVGGRLRAGRHPEPGRTVLLRGKAGGWESPVTLTEDTRVNGAVFTDADADGDPDLVLACEWDSLRFFRNDGGTFVDATAQSGLDRWKGLWNGVTTGDFNGDGQLDLVASNWGRNWRIDQSNFQPAAVELVYGEFGEPGVVHSLLVSVDPASGERMPWRSYQALAKVIPGLTDRIPTHRAYGQSSLSEMIGPAATRATVLSADSFDSMIFLNRGGRFEGIALPVEAQFAPAFGVSAADFDGDGHDDVFLAQNFFGVDPETSRQDAGTGLILLGDGRGGFRALPPAESGFSIPGEQRGSAVGDLDQDGRPDLAVGQSRGPVQVLRNLRGTPGVGITLRGPDANTAGIGAVVRLQFGDRAGVARELHAGSGFRSQDSSRMILPAPEPPKAVEVRWPGGKREMHAWPPGAREVEISAAEGIRRASTLIEPQPTGP